MSKFFLRDILLIVISIAIGSCEYIYNLTDDSDIVEQKISIGRVQHIIVDASCRIILHNSDNDVALIRGSERILDKLKLTNKHEKLFISHAKKEFLQKSRLIEIDMSACYLNRLTANVAMELVAPETIVADNFVMIMNGGAKFAEIELDLDCNSVTLNVYGNNNIGNYYLSGKANNVSFTLEGSVNISACLLESEKVNVVHKSIGSCSVNSKTTLFVKTYSTGNTYYVGEGVVEHERVRVSWLHNAGEVIKID